MFFGVLHEMFCAKWRRKYAKWLAEEGETK
jgi:hypothetical protein